MVVDEEGMDELERQMRANMQAQVTAKSDLPDQDNGDGLRQRSNRIADRESDYQRRRLNRTMTPARVDAYAMGDQTPDAAVSTYADTLRRAQLNREADNTAWNIKLQQKEAEKTAVAAASQAVAASRPRRNRWGDAPTQKAVLADATPAMGDATPAADGFADATPKVNQRWDATPGPSLGDATPAHGSFGDATPAANRWDATPMAAPLGGATPKASRWDATPAVGAATPGMTPAIGDATPARKRSRCVFLACCDANFTFPCPRLELFFVLHNELEG
jgi:splicing factor 3B subunit 1